MAAPCEVVNAFAFRTVSPKILKESGYIVSEDNDNDYYTLQAIRRADKIVCAWGANDVKDRAHKIFKMIEQCNRGSYCLGKTKDGHPRHPLYVPYSQALEPFHP